MDLIGIASLYAEELHQGQYRKYTNEPYITHPRNVEAIVRSVGLSEEARICALLHDTMEDCAVTYGEISAAFGDIVATGVVYLTDNTPISEGNRAYRKLKYCMKLSEASAEVQSVKLADMIDNTSSIVKYDPNFAKTYIREKEDMLKCLTKGHPVLIHWATSLIELSSIALNNIGETSRDR